MIIQITFMHQRDLLLHTMRAKTDHREYRTGPPVRRREEPGDGAPRRSSKRPVSDKSRSSASQRGSVRGGVLAILVLLGMLTLFNHPIAVVSLGGLALVGYLLGRGVHRQLLCRGIPMPGTDVRIQFQSGCASDDRPA